MVRGFLVYAPLFIASAAFASSFVVEASTPIISASGELTESVGVETIGQVFAPLLHRGCKTPCTDTKIFSTAEDFQEQVAVRIFRGNSRTTKDIHYLGSYSVTGFSRMLRGKPRLALAFSVRDGRITLEAIDQGNGKPLEITRQSK